MRDKRSPFLAHGVHTAETVLNGRAAGETLLRLVSAAELR